MSITLKEFKEKYNSVYPNNDLTYSQIADYYYLSLLHYPGLDKRWINIEYSPTELKFLLTGTSVSKIKQRYRRLPSVSNYYGNLELFKKYYPNSIVSAYYHVMDGVFKILFFKKLKQFRLKLLSKIFTKLTKKMAHIFQLILRN